MMQRYHNALYLNNAAVTFLTQGEYHFAASASKGALQLIKSVVEQADADSPCTTTAKANALIEYERSIVQVTAQRLASLPFSTKTNSHIRLNVATLDGSLTSLPIGNGATAIVINDASLDDMNGITPSILLSNFALVQLCLGQVKEPCDNSSVDGTLRLLDVSLGTLGVHQRTMEVNEGNVFVALSLVSNICYILQHHCTESSQWDLHEHIAAAHQELALLQEVSQQLTSVSSSFVPVAGAA